MLQCYDTCHFNIIFIITQRKNQQNAISVIEHLECIDNAEEVDQVVDQAVNQASRGGRDFGDIGSILAIAG